MNFPWAICIAREDAATLAPLRLIAGLEVGEEGAVAWLRGPGGDEHLQAQLARVPARARYEWLASNQLRALHQRIPTIPLPHLRWQPLPAWLQVELPLAALPGTQPPATPLRLVRSTHECEPELLLTRLAELNQFAAVAARVRLDRLQFAANAEGSALVRGRPLPPLPGGRFVLHGGVAVPAGFYWEPAVSPKVLARRLGASGDTLVLWAADGTITRLHREQFVPASRSAIRATAQALAEPR